MRSGPLLHVFYAIKAPCWLLNKLFGPQRKRKGMIPTSAVRKLRLGVAAGPAQ